MGVFKAAESVEAIGWDFTGVKGIKPVALLKGELEEPSTEQVDAFLAAYQELIELSVKSAVDAQHRLDSLDDEDTPGADEAVQLPYSQQAEAATRGLIAVGVPEELLSQLKPRYISALFSHVLADIQGEGDAAPSNG